MTLQCPGPETAPQGDLSPMCPPDQAPATHHPSVVGGGGRTSNPHPAQHAISAICWTCLLGQRQQDGVGGENQTPIH